jgi:hypothetical protein
MILGIFSRDAPESKAREALDRLRGMVVDYNELRVVAPIELAEALGDYPGARLKCEDVSRALNSIFAHEHAVSLEHLADLPKKEMRAYLDQIEGLEPYTRARIQLQGLQRHAIPLDEAMWAYARQAQIVDGRCPLAEAQQFLERQVPEKDALEFVALLKRQAWAELGALVRKGESEPIRSAPPDRTASNMLQLISQASAPTSTAEPETPHVDSTDRAEEPPAPAETPAKPTRSKPRSSTKRRERDKRRATTRPKRKAKAPAKPKARKKPTKRKTVASRRSRKQSRRTSVRKKSA